MCCSITRRDPPATFQFFDACLVLGVEGRLLPYTETKPDISLEHLDLLDLNKYDCIVTHGAGGEYGHVHHIGVHDFITRAWKHKPIITVGYKEGQYKMALPIFLDPRIRHFMGFGCSMPVQAGHCPSRG